MQMQKAWDHSKDDLESYLSDYTYYRSASNANSLTDELDAIKPDQLFDESVVFKILLWKVHRYAHLGPDLLNRLNDVGRLNRASRDEAKPIVEELLRTDGIDLPMASTLLRFRNPTTFQIIDRRAFRSVMKQDHYNLYSGSSPDRKVNVYFNYLEAIDKLCENTGINFADADRILYQFDKKNNGALKGEPREGWDEQFRLASEVSEDPDAEAKENEWLKSFEKEQ